MASLQKSLRRQKNNHKARHGMRTSNKSIFVIVATIGSKQQNSKGK